MFHDLTAVLYASLLLAVPSGTKAPVSTASAYSPTIATIRRRVEEVRVSFSVQEGAKALRNASADQFTVYDNARAISSFTTFAETSDLPLRVGLLVDRSDSVGREFGVEQEAARQFLKKVIRPQTDSVFRLDFTHKFLFHQPTLKVEELTSSGAASLFAGGQTALYDAIYAAAQVESMNGTETEPVRRAVILLSDGEDNCSMHGLDDAILAAQRRDIAIYAITVHSKRVEFRGDAVLRELAEATGGQAYVLTSVNKIDSVFDEIQEELRSVYTVGFRMPVPDQCGYHTLSVEAHDPKLIVRARQGYVACK
jgi:VWFA-related protein